MNFSSLTALARTSRIRLKLLDIVFYFKGNILDFTSEYIICSKLLIDTQYQIQEVSFYYNYFPVFEEFLF